MPVKKDYTAGKNYQGSHFGGEGKNSEAYKQKSSYEYTGVYKSGPNPKLSQQKGTTAQYDGKEEHRSFDGNTPGYGGPSRAEFTPTNLGTRNPDDLQHSKE